ncbi:MAG: hypothetical protein IVW57_05580 [Ktedonobacterales bacterium]|nr:hypothetical protein [Ktedonobacterales bacterium]
MPEYERVITDEKDALALLDIHHGMLLGCPAVDLRRPGWRIQVARAEGDPTALLFGRRSLLQLVSPLQRSATSDRAGVAVVMPELRAPLAALLRVTPPEALLAPAGLAALDALVRSVAGDDVTAPEAAHQWIRYTFSGSFRPYLGQWLEWIEPLDEAREMDPVALGLLARFGRGVFVVRRAGAIVAYAGMRQQSPSIWELTARTTVESLQGHGLARAIASRATRATLAAGRLPLAGHPAASLAAARVAAALGYRLYGEAITYSTTA